MGESNAELAARIIRDLDELIARLDPDVVWDNTQTSPPDHDGIFRGRAEVEQIIREWVGTWSEYRIEVEEVLEVGDTVILVVVESGRGSGSGLPITHRHAYLWTFRDGLIVSGTARPSKREAMEHLSRSGRAA